MLLTGCDDQIMEWGTPEGHNGVTAADLPLAVKEVLANYDDIKAYAAEHHPNMIVGLGVGKDIYMGSDGRHELAADNFQMVTWGNAMKMDAIVGNSGALNFANLDPALDQLTADGMKLYGHNFFWHTQQNQTYLKSLIVPDVEIIQDAGGNIENIVANSDFEEGHTGGWGAWSSDGCKQEISDKGEGYESDYAIRLYNPVAGANYSAQAFYTLPNVPLEVGETYILSFYVKADHVDTQFQAELQNRTSYSAKKYFHQPIPTADTWYFFEEEFEMTQEIVDNEPSHITIDYGAETGYVWLDNVQFGKKISGPTNYVENGSFENGTNAWSIGNGADGIEVVELADAVDGKYVLKATSSDASSNYWDCQITTPGMPTFPGDKVRISFFIKSDQPGQARVSYPSGEEITNQWPWCNWTGNQSSWTESFETNSNWLQINYVMQNMSHDFADGATTWHFCIDLGKLPNVTYYVDDVRVTLLSEEGEDGNRAATRRVQMKYTPKTAEEKYDALVGAMETWVKGMAEHLAEKGIVPVGYDVINEAIADGSNGVRGLNGIFGGSVNDDNGNTIYDSAPEETESDINLNWGSGHWYWGYYVPDYAVKAFQFARQYLPAETKLFYNDYNLDTSDSKRAAAIQFVKDIDAANGATIVDGIGTQMHITLSGTSDDLENNANKVAELRAKLDKQFKELAATGKLIRVTELDITLGTGSPSAAQYQAQSDAYRAVFESYLENVPEAQQSGITIWSLTDADDEHEYWLKGEVPNLWDKEFKRKWAYKGVCDGLAGEDLGLKYGGEDYKAFYEKNNVSETVK